MIPPNVFSIGAEWQNEVAGGANRYTYDLARALGDLGIHQQWVVVGKEPVSPSSKCNVTAAAPSCSSLPWRLKAIKQQVDESSQDADILTSHFSLNAFPLRKHLQCMPHVVHFHGPWADESRAEGAKPWTVWAKRWLERSVYKTADRFITLSQAFAEVLEDRYRADPARIHVIPGGVDIDRFDLDLSRTEAREHLGWPTDRPIVLCVRRLVRRVGLEALVDAMKDVRSACPDALLLIAGKGPLASELEELTKALGVSNSVRMLGFVSEEDLPVAYRAADVSVVPSQSLEGFGLIITESLASGTPVLVTPVGGMPEVVRDLDPNLIFADSSAGAIAEGISAALSGAMQLPADEACQAYTRERFAWPMVAKQVLGVYQEAIESHG